MIVLKDSVFTDPGVLSVIDNNDGIISNDNVTITIPSNLTQTLGEYDILYEVSDATGNIAQKIRKVNVVESLYENHKYIGLAPTGSSNNNIWEPLNITLENNSLEYIAVSYTHLTLPTKA